MTTQARSQCDACVHFRSAFQRKDGDWGGNVFCAAFPEADGGIPPAVYSNQLDHRQPVDGDHGIRWTARAGERYPDWALPPA